MQTCRKGNEDEPSWADLSWWFDLLRGTARNDLKKLALVQSKAVTNAWGFGIVPSTELQDAGRVLLEELCERASDEAGVEFSPVIATDYRELVSALQRGEIGFAGVAPVPAV